MDALNDFFLEANPNPERRGCPDEQKLRDIGENRAAQNDPARLHLASCSECYAEFRGYQREWKVVKERRRNRLGWAAAAVFLIGSGLTVVGVNEHRSHQHTEVATASEPLLAQVDLFEAPTLRGGGDEPSELQQVSLPPAVVALTVTLPRFSKAGEYEIRVSRDRAGREMLAEATGVGAESAGKVLVRVLLDLRKAQAGAYFLATIRGSDNGLYFYPLQIK